ncbi:hypothetical protein EOPP23_12040 [Endozoicomonas sp. OPT23]|uniref:PilW family protein n=1 Tax=Endozoicomonas sp. OPT23 TaxID=2072845 RepID=UPI00129A966D|nr:PilW family protein [Endozoicomonas sp. OPT23]MRI33717.1 hypothetical protein [Endozoicomonas sp. OPT23]
MHLSRMGQVGLSLVEMMVAVVLGLVLIAGVGHLFLGANKSLLARNELAMMQENARYALDAIAQDIRVSGQTGCPSDIKLANAVYSTKDDRQWMIQFDKGISGIPQTDKKYVDTDAKSEAIVIHQIALDQWETVTSHNLSGNELTVSATDDERYRTGKLVAAVAPDCTQISLFRSGATSTGNKVSHETTVTDNLYNRTNKLGGQYTATDLPSLSNAVEQSLRGYQIYPVTSVAYYVRNTTYKIEDHQGDDQDIEVGIPTLYRRPVGEATNGYRLSTEQLVEGVENLVVHYGVDSNDDGVADQYQRSSSITLGSADWKQVISVRLELLMRSLEPVADKPQSYFFNGSRTNPTDKYLRQNVVMTVELRNRSR